MNTITALYTYPIKSCRGNALTSLDIGPKGVSHDREWVVVDANNATQVLTQCNTPQLACVDAVVRPYGSFPEALHVEVDGVGGIVVLPTTREREDDRVATRMQKVTCYGYDQGRRAREFFSDFLGRPARLLRMAPADMRTPPHLAERWQTRFGYAYAYPLHLTTEASLTSLNAMRPPGMSLITMDRFRPNIVLKGCGPRDEENWDTFSIQGIPFHGVSPCVRCSTITTDQRTGERDSRLTALLVERHYEFRDRKPVFGINLVSGTVPGGEARLTIGATIQDLHTTLRAQ